MKKTILIVAAAIMVGVTGLKAASSNPKTKLITHTVDVTSLDVSSFCKAIMLGDVEMVKKLIALGEDVNQKSLGLTPAIFAARYNKAEILQVLIDNGANLKIKSDNGISAKKYAEQSNAVEALKVIKFAMKK